MRTHRALSVMAAVLGVIAGAVPLAVDSRLANAQPSPQSNQVDPLPSWNDGPRKSALLDFIRQTTDPANPNYVSPEDRVVTFDQDGTLWVEHPMYTEVMYCLSRVPKLVEQKPELKDVEPYKTILTGDKTAMLSLSTKDWVALLEATHGGMPVDVFRQEVKEWLRTAKHPRWNRLYTELTYLPMQELIRYFRANGYKTFIVTGGGQDFVRVFSEQVYGIPPAQVVGTMGSTKFEYGKDGKPVLIKKAQMLLNDNFQGKAEGIHLMIGRRPFAAFGNSTGDQEMLEYTKGGDRLRLSMLVLHDDDKREYAYGPAQGLPATKVGEFTQKLYDEAIKNGWHVISMKNDWKRIFSFDQ